jgi:serine/threonine-protein kinase
MKRLIPPAAFLFLSAIGLAIDVSVTAPQMPPQVATHFGFNGEPDGWMTPSSYGVFILCFGLGLPAFTTALGFLSRFLPAWTINIPNKDYWLAPERRPLMNSYLLQHLLWLAALELCFVGGLHHLTIQANRSVPVHMPQRALIILMGVFFLLMTVWMVSLFRHFRRVTHPRSVK